MGKGDDEGKTVAIVGRWEEKIREEGKDDRNIVILATCKPVLVPPLLTSE